MSRIARRAALLLVLALMCAPVSAAQAVTSEASGFRVIAEVCSWGQTWVSTDWGRPGLQSVATTDRSWSGQCDDTGYQSPAWQVAVAQNLVSWSNTRGEFRCSTGDWYYNNWGPSHEVWTSYSWSYKPCGDWYRGDGFAARYHNGWLGHEKPPVSTGWVYIS